MSLSTKVKRLLQVALGDKTRADELSLAIDNASAGVVPAGSISEVELVTAVATKLNNGDATATAVSVPNGILKGDGTGAFSAIADNSAAWDALIPISAAVNLAGVAPTNAQMIAAFGAVATNAGKHAVMSDSSDATKTYSCICDGASWFQIAGTKGL